MKEADKIQIKIIHLIVQALEKNQSPVKKMIIVEKLTN
jgi:hypothetical protein